MYESFNGNCNYDVRNSDCVDAINSWNLLNKDT